MPDVRPLVPKTIDHPFFFSHLLMERPDEEEYGQGIWNDLFENPPLGATIESFYLNTGATAYLNTGATAYLNTGATAYLNTGATAATQDINLKSFMYEDSSTESRTLEKNEKQADELIWKILDTQSIPDRISISKRLFELLEDVKEEETESAGISIESLRSFYNFLQTHSNLKKPAIALTPINDIYVSWKDELGSVFSINFLSSGFVRFAIIAYSERSDQPTSLSGLVKTEDLVKNVKPWGVLKWAGREGR